MSHKLDISTVIDVIKRHKVAPPEARSIIEELNALLAQEEEGKEESVPRQKSQFIVLNTEPSTAWIVQLAEQDGPHTVFDRINQAAHAFNATKKGRLVPVTTIGEALETVKRKQMKEAGILKVCTKLPVAVITGPNKLSQPPTV